MAQPRTAQQIADAAAKRRITQAANKAAGLPTVRQARAAARAAKAGQPFVAPTPRPAPSPRPFGGRRRRQSNRPTAAPYVAPAPTAPMFAPRQSYRALKLAAMVALEAAFVAKLEDAGGVATITEETRRAFKTYKAAKTRALATASTSSTSTAQQLATQKEDDAALLVSTIAILKLAY